MKVCLEFGCTNVGYCKEKCSYHYNLFYRQKNKKEIFLQRQNYRELNKELQKKRKIDYREKNPQKVKQSLKNNFIKNKEKIELYKKEWRIRNPDKISQYRKISERRHPELSRAKCARRRSLQKHNFNMSREIKELYKNCPKGMHIDHIIPLVNKQVCGLHVTCNLQYLTKTDNSIKNNKFDGTYNNESWRKK